MPTRPKSYLQRLGAAGLRMQPRADEARRPSSTAQGYGRRWQRLRRMVLRRDPICRDCQRAPSTEADHILARAKGGEDTMENLRGLCKPCHSRKTVREDGALRPRAHYSTQDDAADQPAARDATGEG